MTNALETISIPMPETDLADPFLSDIFASNGETHLSDPPSDILEDPEPASQNPYDWTSRLPIVSRKLLASSVADEKFPEQIPEVLCTAIEEALIEVVFAGSGKIRCQLGSIAECDLFEEAAASSKIGSLAIPIVLEQGQSLAAVMVGGGFVHRVTDKLFGASGKVASNKISPIEIAIAEFLAARAITNINGGLGDAFFSVAEASLMPTDLFNEHEVGTKAFLEIQGQDFSQSFPLLISRGFFSGLKNISGIADSEPDRRNHSKLLRAVRSIPVRAQIGSTRLDSATLRFLEPGDIVLVENSPIDWHCGSPKGEVRLMAGAGNNFVLSGELKTNDNSGHRGIRVLITDISSREAVEERTARLIMEDKKTVDVELEEVSQVEDKIEMAESEENNEMSVAVENLQLRLRVELAGNRMSLREINDLRVGQVIDLGRGPNDSVSLITDGSDEMVATGELVDIDGSLGVRLTKVFL